MCLNEETYGRVCQQTFVWHISRQEWFETTICFIISGFKLCIKYAIRGVQVNQDGFKLNGTCQLLVYADDVNTFDESIHNVTKKKTIFISC